MNSFQCHDNKYFQVYRVHQAFRVNLDLLVGLETRVPQAVMGRTALTAKMAYLGPLARVGEATNQPFQFVTAFLCTRG